MVRQGEEARNRMAKEIKEKTTLVQKRENTVKTVTGELLKANEIIRKVQEGVKQEQGKSKLRGQIATEKKRLLVTRTWESVGSSLESVRSSSVDSTTKWQNWIKSWKKKIIK
jgi:hypothetical protein